MDFKINNPSHIFAALLLLGSFLLIFGLPIMTFLYLIESPVSIENLSISEIAAIGSQLFVIAVFILVPFVWYYLVNKLSFKEMLKRIKLVGENIDKAFLWGILSAIIIFILIFVIEFALIGVGVNVQDLSNIPDLQKLFSWPVLFFLVAVQPIGEEIFFRGFLLEKVQGFGGDVVAIILTAFLFGIAHFSYGKIYPVLIPILIGIILGYIVVRTKNLYSSIVGHIIFNVTSLSLAYLGQYLLQQFALNL